MGLGGAKRSRSPSDASPVAFCLLCRHGQSRSPPAGGEIPRREIGENRSGAPRSWPRPASLAPAGQFTFSRPTKAFRNSPPHPSGLTASHLPPRGKAFGRPSVPPLRRKGRFLGGEDTAPTKKKNACGRAGRRLRGTKMGGFSNPGPGPRSPCA